MTQPAYMGGPINPQGGLLASPSNYSYPLTSGLLSSLMPQQSQQPPPNSWSQLAYQMAGSPKQGGMYASVATPPSTAGSGSSASSLAAILPLLGGLLGGSGAGNTGIVGALQSLLGGNSAAQNLRTSGSTIPSTPVLGSYAATGSFGPGFTPLDPSQLSNPFTSDYGLSGSPQSNGADLSGLFGSPDTSLSDPVPDDLGGLADIPQFSFDSAGGQAATPGQSSLSLGQVANTGLAGLGLFNAANAGSGIGVAGAGANLAHDLGVPSSITNPVSTGATLAGLGMNLATGNYLPAAATALGMGGAAAKIPTSLTQPLALLMSAITANPLGMAVNGAKVGGGLLNMLQGLNYNGSWTPSQTQLNADEQMATDNGNALIAAGPNAGPATTYAAPQQTASAQQQQPAAPTFTAAQLANLGQSQAYSAATNLGLAAPGTFSGQPTQMMNQGEAATPVAPYSQDAMQYMAYQQAMQQAAGNPQLMQQVADQFQGLMSG